MGINDSYELDSEDSGEKEDDTGAGEGLMSAEVISTEIIPILS